MHIWSGWQEQQEPRSVLDLKDEGCYHGFNYAPIEHAKVIGKRVDYEQRVYDFSTIGTNTRAKNCALSSVSEVGNLEVETFRVNEVQPLTEAERAQQQGGAVAVSPMVMVISFPHRQEFTVPMPAQPTHQPSVGNATAALTMEIFTAVSLI